MGEKVQAVRDSNGPTRCYHLPDEVDVSGASPADRQRLSRVVLAAIGNAVSNAAPEDPVGRPAATRPDPKQHVGPDRSGVYPVPSYDAGGQTIGVPNADPPATVPAPPIQAPHSVQGDEVDLRSYPYFTGVTADVVALRSQPLALALPDNTVASLRRDVRLVVESRTGRWAQVRVESGTAVDEDTQRTVDATGLTGYVPAEVLVGDDQAQRRATITEATAGQHSGTPRPAGEAAKSRTLAGILPNNVEFHPAHNQLDIVDFAVNSSVLPPDVVDNDGWQQAMSLMAGDPFMRVAVTGFTDRTGGDAENLALRQERGQAVIAAMPATVRAKVLFSGNSTTTDFIDTNDTEEGRARNRSVRVRYTSDTPVGQDPCGALDHAGNLDEYLFLVRCLETRLGLTSPADARTALSVLRQLYYGSAAWSTSRNWVWDRVIATHPWNPGTDPTPALGSKLVAALKRGQVVEGIDIGHILTGLDAMIAPEDVLFTKGPFGLRLTLANEEWATWAGDVGSAAAEWAWDSFMVKPNHGGFDTFFRRFAGDADLLGDIDGFAIRVGLAAAGPSTQLMRPLKLTGSLSSVLLQYFRITRGALGTARTRHIQDFVAAYGGVVVNRSLTNKAALAARFRPSIAEFANLYLEYRLHQSNDDPPPGAPRLDFLLTDALDDMVPRFVDWLAARL